MSGENARIVIEMIEAWSRGDRESARAAYDPHAVVIMPVVDSPVLTGMDAVERGLEAWRRSWEGYAIEVADLIDAGDHIVVAVRQRGVGKATGAEVDLAGYGVHTLRNGKVIRAEWFADRARALEAAGLPDEE